MRTTDVLTNFQAQNLTAMGQVTNFRAVSHLNRVIYCLCDVEMPSKAFMMKSRVKGLPNTSFSLRIKNYQTLQANYSSENRSSATKCKKQLMNSLV